MVASLGAKTREALGTRSHGVLFAYVGIIDIGAVVVLIMILLHRRRWNIVPSGIRRQDPG